MGTKQRQASPGKCPARSQRRATLLTAAVMGTLGIVVPAILALEPSSAVTHGGGGVIKAAQHDRSRPPARCPYHPRNQSWPSFRHTRACMRHEGTGKRVLMVGDSHAEDWMPALIRIAKNRDWTLASLTRLKCGPLHYQAYRASDHSRPTIGAQCARWRRVAYPTVIADFRPDIVLIAGRTQHYDIDSGRGVIHRSGETNAWYRHWKRSWHWTVRTLGAGGARLGAFTLLPDMAVVVPACLARYGLHTTKCDTPKRFDTLTARTNAFVRHIHATYPSVRPVQMTRYFCPGGNCKAVLGGMITHWDRSHLTATWVRTSAHEVSSALSKAGLIH
jgi:SGNH domain (fused to AT3 domains)